MEAKNIIRSFKDFIGQNEFPCVAARAALHKDQIHCMVADHMRCPASDMQVLDFLYDFINSYRQTDKTFHSAAIIFRQPKLVDEVTFDAMVWERLAALRQIDAQQYDHDPRVDADPRSPNYSFSLKEEALFVVGLNPASSRKARQFAYPALVFNPHQQFEILRQRNQFTKLRNTVRKRDLSYSGSINPMLGDFGTASEAYQYSGLNHDESWKCPLKKYA